MVTKSVQTRKNVPIDAKIHRALKVYAFETEQEIHTIVEELIVEKLEHVGRKVNGFSRKGATAKTASVS